MYSLLPDIFRCISSTINNKDWVINLKLLWENNVDGLFAFTIKKTMNVEHECDMCALLFG